LFAILEGNNEFGPNNGDVPLSLEIRGKYL